MRALSLTQPWATLMALGQKRIETRSWRPAPQFMGQVIAIHAAKGFPGYARELVNDEPFLSALNRIGYDALPIGAIIAVGRLAEVRRTEQWTHELSRNEEEFGDYGDGRFGWRFEQLRALAKPVPCKGALGIWTVPSEIAALIQPNVSGSESR